MADPRRAAPADPLVTAALSDVGVVRDHNEDSFLVTPPDYDAELLRRRGRLFVVADGMGGAVGGELASRLVVETIHDTYYTPSSQPPVAALHDALVAANEAVFQQATARPDLKGMGSTCTALAVQGDRAWFAHVGDTRLYLVRDHKILQLTDDHSKVAQMVRDGFLTAEEAETHPERNVLQRSIGPKGAVQVDASERELELRRGDRLVLCSDGLTNHVRDVELLEIVERHPPAAAVTELISLAKQRGGSDNITVQIVQHGAASPRVSAPVTMYPGAPATQVFDPATLRTHRRAMKRRRSRRGLWLSLGLAVLVVSVVVGIVVGRLVFGGGEAPETAAAADADAIAAAAEPKDASSADDDALEAGDVTAPAGPDDAPVLMVRPDDVSEYTEALKCLPKYLRSEVDGMCPAALLRVFEKLYWGELEKHDPDAIVDRLLRMLDDRVFDDLREGLPVRRDDWEYLSAEIRKIKSVQRKKRLADIDGCPQNETLKALDIDPAAECPPAKSGAKRHKTPKPADNRTKKATDK